MRVLSSLTYYHPHWTGLTAHARRLANGLARRGHHLSVLTYRHDATLSRCEVHGAVRIHRVQPIARVSRGMFSPAFVSAAARLVREHDVILVNTPMLEALPIALLGRRFGRPVAVIHHGDLLMPAGAANRLVEHTTTASMIAAARLAACVTTYSEDYGFHSDFLLPFRPKLVAIPPPVEIPLPDAQAAAAWRTRLGLNGRKVIGFAGRFVEEKGGDVLLRALPHVLRAEPTAHLVFAGETSVVYERFFARCRPLFAAVAPHVTLLGLLLDRSRLAEFYAFCDVLALASRSDCFGLVQAEAMLCGTPVVASDIPGAREAVLRTGMGVRVPPEDPAALAAGLLEVLRARDRFVRPRPEIEKIFDAERTIDTYDCLLQDLVARYDRHPRCAAVPRVRPVFEGWQGAQRAALERVLGGESDMAYRRRLPALLEYLELQDGEHVLDAGCGFGGGLRAAGAVRRISAVGVDCDASRILRARRAGAAASVLPGDAAHLPFRAAAFDKALLSEVLEHVVDDVAVLREVGRVLRPGGVLAISVPHAAYPWFWDPINRLWHMLGGRPLRGAQPAGIWSLHHRLYWPDDLARRVELAGLTVERLETTTHYAVPFAHFMVYGIGKPLLERRLLPARWRDDADRLTSGAWPAARIDLLRWGRAVFRAVDRLNDRPAAQRARTFVSVLLKARKPKR